MKSAQERIWRREEKAEAIEAARIAGLHRPDCLCRAVKDWSPGPVCYQQVAA